MRGGQEKQKRGRNVSEEVVLLSRNSFCAPSSLRRLVEEVSLHTAFFCLSDLQTASASCSDTV